VAKDIELSTILLCLFLGCTRESVKHTSLVSFDRWMHLFVLFPVKIVVTHLYLLMNGSHVLLHVLLFTLKGLYSSQVLAKVIGGHPWSLRSNKHTSQKYFNHNHQLILLLLYITFFSKITFLTLILPLVLLTLSLRSNHINFCSSFWVWGESLKMNTYLIN